MASASIRDSDTLVMAGDACGETDKYSLFEWADLWGIEAAG